MPCESGLFHARTALVLLPWVLLLDCGRSATSYLDKGNALFARGEFAEASLNYRKALQKQPSSGEVYYRLGLVALKQNKAAEAFQDLNQAVRLMPENPAARSELGNLTLTSYLADPKRPKILYDVLAKLSDDWLKKDPRSAEGLRIKGYLALVERRPEEAAELFQSAHQSDPGEVNITLGLVDALFQDHKVADAERVGLDFITNNKNAGSVYDALYRLYTATNRPAEAENILIRKVKENPKESAYALQLAGHYARSGKKAELAGALQMLLKNPGNDPDVHLSAGDFYSSIADRTGALDQYKEGLAANPKNEALYQERIARLLVVEGKREEALKLLDGIVKANSASKPAQALRAALLVENSGPGEPDKGIAAFQSLVDKDPEDVLLRYMFAGAYLEKNNLRAARAQLIEVIKRSPSFVEAHLSLAQIALREGRPEEALRAVEVPLDLAPDNFRGQYLRGSALLALGNLNEAGAVLNNLSRQAPQSVDVRLQLALLDTKRKKFREAQAGYEQILEFAPNEWRAVAGLVDIYSAQQRLDLAVAMLEQQLHRSQGASPIRALLAETAVKAAKYDVAIEQYRQLAADNPGSIEPQLQLANALRLKGDTEGAMDILQKAAVIQPADARPPAMLASLLEESDRENEAVAQARKALSLRPDDAALMNNLAFLLADTGDRLDEALQLARQAIAKAPDQPNYFDTLGWAYLKSGMPDEAIQVFRKLVRQNSDNSLFCYHLGMALYQKGDAGTARIQLSRALYLNPPNHVRGRITGILNQMDSTR